MKKWLSILVATTPERAAFHPWLLWNIGKQAGVDWDSTEIVVAGVEQLGPAPCAVRYVPGFFETLGEKRQALIDAADGQSIAWFDDDDWHHPERLWQQHARARYSRIGVTGTYLTDRFFHNLWTSRGLHFWGREDEAVPISFVGLREVARSVRVEPQSIGEDSLWFERVAQNNRLCAVRTRTPYFVGLIHGSNTCYARYSRWKNNLAPGELAAQCGPAWGAETEQQLTALMLRLTAPDPKP